MILIENKVLNAAERSRYSNRTVKSLSEDTYQILPVDCARL